MKDKVSCSVCLETKNEPVTLRCGHNFCQECVAGVLSAPEEFGVSACAECQEWLQEQQNKEELPNPDSSQSGLNLDSLQSGLNPNSLQSGLNPDSSQSGLNPDSSQSGLNLGSLQSGLNPGSLLSGLNLNTILSGLNLDSSQSEPNLGSLLSGLNLGFLLSGLNLDSSQSEPNLDSSQSEPNLDSSQSEPNLDSLQSEPNLGSLLSGLNLDSSQSEPNPKSSQSEPNPNQDSSQSEVEGTRAFCTFCLDSSARAVKYCLRCEASLCGQHLLVHKASPEHVLCDPTTSPHNHSALTHKGSDEVMIDLLLEKLTTKKEKTQKRALSQREHREKVREKAAGVTDGVNVLFKRLRKQLKFIQKWVLQETSRQEKEVLQSVSERIRRLEMETEELSRKVQQIEELRALRGPSYVLQDEAFRDIDKSAPADEDLEDEDLENEGFRNNNKAACADEDLEDEDLENEGFRNNNKAARADEDLENEGFRNNNKAARADEDLEDEDGDVNEESLSEIIHDALFQVMIAVSPEIRTPSLTQVQLDLDTAADNVCISRDLQSASWSVLRQNRPATPQRFESFQVLSSTVFPSGRYYWRVKTSGSGSWRVGVCYPSMERRGGASVIGENYKSWCVCQICDSDNVFSHAAKHDSDHAALPSSLSCNRLGIYLDYEAGRLSFYELGLPIRLLRTFTATFTEPLHAAIYVCGEEQQCPTWVRFMD